MSTAEVAELKQQNKHDEKKESDATSEVALQPALDMTKKTGVKMLSERLKQAPRRRSVALPATPAPVQETGDIEAKISSTTITARLAPSLTTTEESQDNATREETDGNVMDDRPHVKSPYDHLQNETLEKDDRLFLNNTQEVNEELLHKNSETIELDKDKCNNKVPNDKVQSERWHHDVQAERPREKIHSGKLQMMQLSKLCEKVSLEKLPIESGKEKLSSTICRDVEM